eukprot:Lithocolla_globosa_v1_NODE_6458_length_1084_cov_178.950437.p2 type:complete len:158 gc:universal NODE_6458_length_1084_cov_178.950437:581-1054(+)
MIVSSMMASVIFVVLVEMVVLISLVLVVFVVVFVVCFVSCGGGVGRLSCGIPFGSCFTAEENNRYPVLEALRVRRFASHHSEIKFRSVNAFFLRERIFLSRTSRVVSSANMYGVECSKQFGKSFMYKIKNKGPSMEPCGTPHVISIGSESKSSMRTC